MSDKTINNKIWHREFELGCFESEDLSALDTRVHDVPESLSMCVVRLGGSDALHSISKLTDGSYCVLPFDDSEMRDRVPPDFLPKMNDRTVLINPYGVTVLVSGTSKGFVTVVREGPRMAVFRHNSSETAGRYLSSIAACHRVTFNMYEMIGFFGELFHVSDAD